MWREILQLVQPNLEFLQRFDPREQLGLPRLSRMLIQTPCCRMQPQAMTIGHREREQNPTSLGCANVDTSARKVRG